MHNTCNRDKNQLTWNHNKFVKILTKSLIKSWQNLNLYLSQSLSVFIILLWTIVSMDKCVYAPIFTPINFLITVLTSFYHLLLFFI